MNMIKKLFTILIVFFGFIDISNSQDNIVYLDLDRVVSNTKAGKLIISKLEKSKNATFQKFNQKEKDLKKKYQFFAKIDRKQ